MTLELLDFVEVQIYCAVPPFQVLGHVTNSRMDPLNLEANSSLPGLAWLLRLELVPLVLLELVLKFAKFDFHLALEIVR